MTVIKVRLTTKAAFLHSSMCRGRIHNDLAESRQRKWNVAGRSPITWNPNLTGVFYQEVLI
ncbi:hypothetical protein E2C01_065424 [Portunus trituberculatus]|uniref:Uncharacterized protein n=1 Tax=Portunus trituberculatus TaxID=210409 RepID=A0A5B7HRP8_PORTR|nr:hypothetical protein [Portunus trituberculatus]